MAVKVEKSKARELIPAKRYRAVLVGIYDIGHRTGQYGPYHQMVFSYELHNRKGAVRDGKGEAVVISAFLDVTLTKKGKPSPLAMHLSALLGKQVDSETFSVDDTLLEKGCELTVIHEEGKDKTIRDNIGTVIAFEEDDQAPDAVSDSTYYEIPRDPESKAAVPPTTSEAIPDAVPVWVQNQVRKSLEFAGAAKAGGKKKEKARESGDDDEDGDDDIPY